MSSVLLILQAGAGEDVHKLAERAVQLVKTVGFQVEMRHNDRRVLVDYKMTTADVLAEWRRQPSASDDQVEVHDGVWVAYFPDRTGAAVFADELACLRYALARGMTAGRWDFGTPMGEVR